MKVRSLVVASIVLLTFLATATGTVAWAYYAKVEIPLDRKTNLPGFIFLPRCEFKGSLPAVVIGVGVGGTKILQYHDHCQCLADRGFVVLLIDPSNYPEFMAPGPWTWDRDFGYALGSFNQGYVGAKLALGKEWYLKSFKASVDYLTAWPLVDREKIALSGFSQPANAALSCACRDPRVKAVVWNYGGWPWIMPYEPFRLPPVAIFHGEDDEVYDVKYARELALNLKTSMRPFELNIYPNQKHMFNIYYDLRNENRFMKPALLDAFERMVAFLKETMGVDRRKPRGMGRRAALHYTDSPLNR
ncbi:MAG: dienelactone hydrolase family protein [Pseudomonadota bacterium]